MQTDLFTVSKLFTETLLRIPDYQRGYAWTSKQLKDYWNDLKQLEENKSHYLGVLTLEDVSEENVQSWEEDQWIIVSKGYTPFYVVDGQQRLTTTIILIQAITESVNQHQRLNYTSIDDIKRKFLWDSKDDGISRSYIFGYEKDNPSYEFLKTRIFLESSNSSSTPQYTIYTHNLARAKDFFLKSLSSASLEELETIYRKVTQQLLFNIYAISKEVDVFVAFETMNNRGKPLSHLELLKNRLIYLSTKFDVEPYEKTNLRTAINESWKSIYHYLGKNKDNPLDDDLFLRNHFLLYFGKDLLETDNSDIRREYKLMRGYHSGYKEYLLERHFTTKSILRNASEEDGNNSITTKEIYKYAQSLKKSVELWYQILNPQDSSFPSEEKIWLDKLNRLGIEIVAPLIMTFFQKTDDKKRRLELLQLIEGILFFNGLVKYRYLMDIDGAIFIDMAAKLSGDIVTSDKVLKDLNTAYESSKSSKELWRNIEKGFRGFGFYSWRGIKYFLFEYELYLRDKTKTYREKIKWDEYIEDPKDHHTVEHVYPQRPKKPCWTEPFKEFGSTERSRLRHSLGNLVPLSHAKNSSFQNKCFEDKKGTEHNKVGFRYGSYSENEIALKDRWTSVEIADRGVSLLDFMEERWSLTIGDRARKLRVLGIEFVANRGKRSKHRSG